MFKLHSRFTISQPFRFLPLVILIAGLSSCESESNREHWVLELHSVFREEWKREAVAKEEWKEIVQAGSKSECEVKKRRAWELMVGPKAIGPIVESEPYERVTYRIDEIKNRSPVTTTVNFICKKLAR